MTTPIRLLALAVPILCLPLVLGVLSSARPVLAQDASWQERSVGSFVLVHPPGTEAVVGHYEARSESIYQALSTAFDGQLELPVTLRLYADDDAYLRANPLFVELGGVLAQARRGRRELAISLPRVLEGAELGEAAVEADTRRRLDNALRLELGQLFVARLSAERMPAGFRNGIAAYMQQPGGEMQAGVARLREARDAGLLIAWTALNAPGAEYLDPPLAQPQSLSIAHFLVELEGFAGLRELLRQSATSQGWREALERSYGRPPSAIEQAWLEWLPRYLDGGWRQHALYRSDLAPAEALMRQGRFEAAVAQLAGSISMLEGTDAEALAPARRALARAEAGLQARQQAEQAAEALADGRYREALDLAAEARSRLAEAGDAAGRDYAAAIAERAAEGAEAEAELARAEALPLWRAAEARLAGYRAMQGLARVGNQAAADRARALVERLDRRQAPLGWLLLGAGLCLVGWSMRQRWVAGDPRSPAPRGEVGGPLGGRP